MSSEDERPKLVARDLVLEELTRLREAHPEDRDAIEREIRTLLGILLHAELENMADAMHRAATAIEKLLEDP